MSSFTNEIKIQALKNNKWLLLEDVYFYDKVGQTTKIPKGFITDGASVPKCLRLIGCPMDLPILKAAIIHDYLRSIGMDKKQADALFLLAMEILKVPFRKRFVYYGGVYYFGGSKYKECINNLNNNENT